MIRWGLCAQVKAPAVAVETFVAWHLELGADWIAVYFDEPDDPAFAALAQLAPRVEAIRCTGKHWRQINGGRPAKKTVRQVANAGDAYARAPVDWMAHVDVDEFILPHRPLPELLASLPADAPLLRLRPWEALANPDGSPPCHFRGSPPPGMGRAALIDWLYGDYAVAMVDGMVGHGIGKCLFRTGLPNLQPRIHVALIDGVQTGNTPGGTMARFTRDAALLHYHADNLADWLGHVPERRDIGAYSRKPDRKSFYESATEADLRAFHAAVQVATPELLDRLRPEGLLLSTAPDLAGARARVFGQGQRT